MGSGTSSNSGSDNPGLSTHCYSIGYEHGSMSTDPDPIGDGIAAAPCTLTKETNDAYAKGYVDAMHATNSYTARNGDRYRGGKLVSFRASNGTRYRVGNRMDNR